MNEFKISLCTIDKVKNFCRIASAITPDMDIISGRYVIDAKSVMGIFSVDLSNPLTLRVRTTNEKECKDIRKKLKDFVI